MKKIVASASVVTLGLLCGQSVQAQQDSKPWNVSATLRGFYDDNYSTLPSKQAPPSPTRRSSFGFELSPSAGYNVAWDTTSVGLRYTYDMKYYEDRRNNSADHSHQADVKLDHAFSERYKASVTDSFVIAQEPSLIDPAIITSPLRTDGNNLRNTASVAFSAVLTEELTADLGYSNTIYDYQQTGAASRSALLDRVEHLASTDIRWRVLDETVTLLGYQFGLTDQTSKDSLDIAANPYVSPSVRDSRSHFLFLGVDETFNSQLSAQARAGFQYIEYPHALAGVKKDALSPYIDIQGTYKYAQDGSVTLGIKHQHSQTDVAFTTGTTPTQDAEVTTVYSSVNHKITPLIGANLIGTYQFSSFNQGGANSKGDNLFMVALNFSYEINKYLTAETGYSYDRLDSDLPARSYYRDRIFIGIRAAY